jgi:thioredoxin-like negative regulator of GroEL
MILITLLTFLFIGITEQNRVIEITTANIELVLKTVDKMQLLLHNPSCQHSKEYAQKFLEVKTSYNLGITDCEREKNLCNHLNVTHFPTLVELTNTSMSILDEQRFLHEEGLTT